MIELSNRRALIKRYLPIYLLMLPGVMLVIVFYYLPMSGAIIAFKDYNISSGFRGMFTSPGVGFANFVDFFSSIYFVRILTNTLLLSFYGFAFFWVPIVFALLLNELKNQFFKRAVQTISYLPYFLSSVVIIGILNSLISPTYGLINALLNSMGINPIYFLGDPKYFRTIYILVGIWQGTGFSAIIYLAAMTSINPELYEAAIIDGANRFRRMWHITLPGIAGIIILLLIMAVGNALNVDAEKVFLMYSPPTYETSDIIDTFVYREGLINGSISYAAAVGLFKSVIAFILVYFANKIANKTGKQGLFN